MALQLLDLIVSFGYNIWPNECSLVVHSLRQLQLYMCTYTVYTNTYIFYIVHLCDMVAMQVLFTSHEPMKLIAYYLVSQHNLNSRRFSVYAMSLVRINSIPTCERFTIARKISPLSRLAVCFQMLRMDQMADSLNCRTAVGAMCSCETEGAGCC